MLCEEVTVNDFDQAIELLNGQQTRGDIKDEISKHFAMRKNISDTIQQFTIQWPKAVLRPKAI
jgi:predicted DNA-binding protein YlxM (UPF0122 family)